MDIFEKLARDPEDIDALLELAALTRQYVSEGSYTAINEIIINIVRRGLSDALLWVMGILDEEFEKEDRVLEDFQCPLGRAIPDFNRFMETMQVESVVLKNDVEKVYDENGEVQSFFNILTYRTGFGSIYLVSSENFDTKDNDYIQYRLAFTKNEAHA